MKNQSKAVTRRVVVTPGEPAGVGPDIVLDIARREFDGELVAVADPELLGARARTLGFAIELKDADGSRHKPGQLAIDPIALAAPARVGELNVDNAEYVLATIRRATALCLTGGFDALCTAPVNKAVINQAGNDFTGHTEFLAELTGAEQPVMLLCQDALRVALATIHIPLSEVPNAITRDGLTRVIDVLINDLTRFFDIDRPRLAVCGLNPHAGESGVLGHEEIKTIAPVIESFRARGLDVFGPLPADTAFTPTSLSQADAVLAMFHDQGLPVVKHAGFGRAVNVTLGLPIIRTSVDHGTALSLAGTGRADCESLQTALELALTLSARRRS